MSSLSRGFVWSLICVSGWLTVNGAAHAGVDALRLTPHSAIDMAIAQNPSSALYKAAVASKRAQLQATTGWVPQVEVSAKTMYGEGEPTSFFATQGTVDPEEPDNSISGGGYVSGSLDFALPIYEQGVFFNRRSPAVTEADKRYAKARHERTTGQVDLAHNVITTYISALQAGAEVGLLQEIYDSRAQQIDAVKRRVATGISPVTDEYALEKALASSLRDLNIVSRREDLHYIRLRLLLGLAVDEQLVLTALSTGVPPLPPLGDLLGMLNEHPRLAMQQAEVEIAKAELSGARAEGGATLSLVSSMTAADNIEGEYLRTFVSVGLNLAVPLTDLVRRNTVSASQAYALQESQFRRAELRDLLMADVYAAYYAVLDANDTIVSQEKVLEQTVSDEQYVRSRYEKGQETIDNLISLENETLGARLGLVSARYAAWSSYAALFNTVGQPFNQRGLVARQ